MKTIYLLLIVLLFPLVGNTQGATCLTATALAAPTTTANCINPTDFAQNVAGMCTGTGGMGYSNYWYRFCTNASNTCVSFLINVDPLAEWMAILYNDACSATIAGTLICNTIGGGSTGGPGYWSTAGNDPGVSLTAPSTCYRIRIQVNDAYASSLNFCYKLETPPEDACVGAIGIDATPDPYNNACDTEGATDPPPAQLCAGSLENTVWYSFTTTTPCGPPCDVVITTAGIDCAGGGEGFQIGYFSGTCASLTNLGCASGSGGTVTATLTGATAGSTYYVALDGNAGANCFYTISATNTVPLPVNMLYVRGFVDDNHNASLQWATATEQNASHFQVSKSLDGINYKLVGSMAAKNNTNSTTEYALPDPEKIITGVTYYKLVQIDNDGNSQEYDPIAIVAKPSINDVLVVPNPVDQQATILFNAVKNGIGKLIVIDIFGKVIIDEQVEIVTGGNSLKFDVSAFASGMYIGRIFSGTDVVSVKFTK